MDSQKRSLKVMMIAPTSFFGDYGGHIRIFEETLALQALGHAVTLVTYYKGRNVAGLDIRRTPPLPYRTDYEVGSSRHKVVFDLFLAAKALQVAIQLKPDVIHGHMHEGALIGAFLAKMLKVPMVFDYQGSLTGEMVDHHFLDRDGRVYPLMHALERWIDHRPKAILTSSSRSKEHLQREFRVEEDRIVPLPDCVDGTRFDPARFDSAEKAAIRKKLGIPQDRVVIAYLGLLADYQGIDDILEAAKLHKKWEKKSHFLLMGYPNVDLYKRRAELMGISDYVTFTGKVLYDVAPSYLSLGEIAISAKKSATEGSGKVLNYMAMGQAIVAYDSDVHREYLGEFGVYPPLGNAGRLGAELAKLIDEPERRKRLGEQLQLRVLEKFSWQAAAKKIEDVYLRLT